MKQLTKLLAVAAVGLTALVNVASATAFSEPQQWKFKVLLDDREIGFHDFTVVEQADSTRVDIDARFDVKFLFFNAYRYRHQNSETWNADCLVTVQAATNDNGRRSTVAGSVEGDAFVVKTSAAETNVGSCPMSFAYWNPSLLQANALLNTQTGELQQLEVTPMGEEMVRYGDAELRANRYDLSVEGQAISLWYGVDDQRWLALEAPAKGGRTIRYRPVSVPAPAEDGDLVAGGE